MIISEIFYGLKCDRCGTVYEDGEHSFWSDIGSPEEYAQESDWIEEKGRHYCPDCYETLEEIGGVVIFDEYPKHLKTLNKFIDKVLTGVYRTVFEYENEFHVKAKLFSRNRFESFEIDYIKSLLGEKLISIDSEDIGNLGDKYIIIKLIK